jgi:tyrosinase
MIERYVFGPVRHDARPSMSRADLEFYGVNHFRPSYLARIFFNDPDVNAESASEDRATYAGSFAMLGHPTCFGGEGHCEVPAQRRRFDDRPSHPLTRAFKRVVVTDALRRYLNQAELTITVIASSDPDATIPEEGPLLEFDGMQLTTFT